MVWEHREGASKKENHLLSDAKLNIEGEGERDWSISKEMLRNSQEIFHKLAWS